MASRNPTILSAVCSFPFKIASLVSRNKHNNPHSFLSHGPIRLLKCIQLMPYIFSYIKSAVCKIP